MSFLAERRYFRAGGVDNFLSDSARNLCAGSMSKIDLTSNDYSRGIAKALQDDYGRSASMVKDICEDTGASSGTVKNWLSELNGPGGEHLIKLIAASPAVRAFIDTVTKREDVVAETHARMRRALAIMEGREP